MRNLKAPNVIPMVRNLGLFFAAILVVVISMFAAQYPTMNEPYVPALSTGFYYEKTKTAVEGLSGRIDNRALKFILNTELPVISAIDQDISAKTGGTKILRICLNLLAGVNLEDPLTYLKSEIPMMAVVPTTAEAEGIDEFNPGEVSEPSQVDTESLPEQTTVANEISSEIPLIALYNTHTSETYEMTDGLTHLKGKAGGVSIVAREIQKTIQGKYNIAVNYIPTIHDMSFNKSYVESEKTVKQFLKDNPKLEMIFDIHRDGSMTREQSLTKVNGKTAAKILIVVGTNARADHPKWRENLEFARKVAAKIDIMYPGLSRGIAIKNGRYNQQYSSRAILIEIGSSKNTTDEAVESGRLFADVVVAVLNDIKNGN